MINCKNQLIKNQEKGKELDKIDNMQYCLYSCGQLLRMQHVKNFIQVIEDRSTYWDFLRPVLHEKWRRNRAEEETVSYNAVHTMQYGLYSRNQ